jgi:hypothetical protein
MLAVPLLPEPDRQLSPLIELKLAGHALFVRDGAANHMRSGTSGSGEISDSPYQQCSQDVVLVSHCDHCDRLLVTSFPLRYIAISASA